MRWDYLARALTSLTAVLLLVGVLGCSAGGREETPPPPDKVREGMEKYNTQKK